MNLTNLRIPMIYLVQHTRRFRRQSKKIECDKKLRIKLAEVIYQLANGIPLEKRYRIHLLQGAYQGCLELHIKPNLLLIYRYRENQILLLEAFGSHNELFG